MFNVSCYLLINGQPIRMISKWKSHQKYMIRQMAFTAFPYLFFFKQKTHLCWTVFLTEF